MKKKLLIFGNDKAAELMFYNFSCDSLYEIVGFTVDKPFIKEKEFCGLPVFPFENIESEYPPDRFLLFIAIGYSKMNRTRALKYEEARSKGYELANYISKKAHIGQGCIIGTNCMVGANTTLQPNVKIGNDVIIRENVYVGHDTVIEDHCFISAASAISGNVKIRRSSFIGVNATLKDNITVEKECIIGAGLTLLHDTKEKEVYASRSSQKLPFTSDKVNF